MSASLNLYDSLEDELDYKSLGDDNPDLVQHLGLRQAGEVLVVRLDPDLPLSLSSESVAEQEPCLLDLLEDPESSAVSLGSRLEIFPSSSSMDRQGEGTKTPPFDVLEPRVCTSALISQSQLNGPNPPKIQLLSYRPGSVIALPARTVSSRALNPSQLEKVGAESYVSMTKSSKILPPLEHNALMSSATNGGKYAQAQARWIKAGSKRSSAWGTSSSSSTLLPSGGSVPFTGHGSVNHLGSLAVSDARHSCLPLPSGGLPGGVPEPATAPLRARSRRGLPRRPSVVVLAVGSCDG